MNSATPEQFCIAESVRLAKSQMSYRDYLVYLRGLLLLAGDRPEVEDLRSTVMEMNHSDAQLDLIAGPQRQLNLGGPAQ